MNAIHKNHVPAPNGMHSKVSEEAAGAAGASGHPGTRHHHEEGVFSISGAVAGAATGAVAGPPGILGGAIVGAALGLVIGKTLDREDERQELHDEELDREIGVEGGDLGAASPDQPPARMGAYSAASAGAGSSTPCASEGPMQSLDDD
jgi:phage tail tape-measure protein